MPTVLANDRIALRTLEDSDSETIFEFCQDEQIQRFVAIPLPFTMENATSFIAKAQEGIATGKNFDLAITLKNDPTLRGIVGLSNKGDGRGTFGYWIGAPHRGERLVREAGALLLKFGFEVLELRRVEAHVYTPNEASAKVLIHHGFMCEGTLRRYAERLDTVYDAYLYALTDEDYFKNHHR